MIVFNRPELTGRLFRIITAQRPETLLIIADGPRPNRPGEAENCRAVREIVSKVDWPCEVLTNFSETNLGCRRRVSSGLDWVFQQVERSIILEDDCMPDPTFFEYCAELLQRYRDEPRVMHITADNFQPPDWTCPDSYYFSKYASIWGWATWRRAWKLYDVDMARWPKLKADNWLSTYLANPREASLWTRYFDDVHSGGCDTWDHQWSFACFSNQGLGITPAVNLVSNLGFGPGATHTTVASPLSDRPVKPMTFPLRHPDKIQPATIEDAFVFNQFLDAGPEPAPGITTRARRRLGRTLRTLGVIR
jgi:hypothetical protein